MNLAEQFNPVSKESQLFNKPVKLSQRQLGEISQKVDKQLKRRSEGVCELQEKCTGSFAVQRAHITARGKLTSKTTVNDLLHVCLPCHFWMDREPEGIQFKRKLINLEESSRAKYILFNPNIHPMKSCLKRVPDISKLKMKLLQLHKVLRQLKGLRE